LTEYALRLYKTKKNQFQKKVGVENKQFRVEKKTSVSKWIAPNDKEEIYNMQFQNKRDSKDSEKIYLEIFDVILADETDYKYDSETTKKVFTESVFDIKFDDKHSQI